MTKKQSKRLQRQVRRLSLLAGYTVQFSGPGWWNVWEEHPFAVTTGGSETWGTMHSALLAEGVRAYLPIYWDTPAAEVQLHYARECQIA